MFRNPLHDGPASVEDQPCMTINAAAAQEPASLMAKAIAGVDSNGMAYRCADPHRQMPVPCKTTIRFRPKIRRIDKDRNNNPLRLGPRHPT